MEGEFVYTPPAGTILADGVGQILSVTFAPVDANNYDVAFASTTIDVDPAIPPIITSSLTAASALGNPFTYTITAEGSTPMTFDATGFPAGLVFTGDTISGNPTSTGVFNIKLTASNYGGSDTRTLKPTVIQSGTNRAPVIVSSPTASVNPAIVGFGIHFSVAAADADGDALDYNWDFGDGTTGSGVTVVKSYAAEGIYMVKVIVSDVQASDTKGLNIAIQDVPEPHVFVVEKIKVAFNFVKVGADRLSISGQVPLASGFRPSGKQVRIVIGGVDNTYTLDKKGNSSNFEFVLKKGSNKPSQFVLNLKKQDLFAKLSDFGFTKTTNAPDIDLPVILILGGRTHFDLPSVVYSAKGNKKGPVSGSAKK